MIKRISVIVIALLLVSACWEESSKRTISGTIFIHDNSSKVWLIQKCYKNGKDVAEPLLQNKDMVIFHESGMAYFYKVKNLGDKRGVKMNYWLKKDNKEFGFSNSKKRYTFEVLALKRTQIILKPKSKSYPYTIVLIPFPEY